MKRNLLVIIVISFILIGANSCKKAESIIGSMGATIDGVAWEATTASVVGYKYSNYITIAGFNINGEKIFISIKGTETGTYTFGILELTGETYAVFFKNKDDENDGTKKYFTTGGTVVVTAITDNRITGTFNFNALNSLSDRIQVTSGGFNNVPYF